MKPARLLAIALLFTTPVVAGPVAAPTRSAAALVHFDIPAGNFLQTIDLFSQQSEITVIYLFDGVEKRETPAISGDFTPAEALERMLFGLEIVPQFGEGKVVTLRRAGDLRAPSLGGERRARHLWHRRAPTSSSTGRHGSTTHAQEEVTVSGWRPHWMMPPAASTITLGRRDIDATGFATASEVIRTLPQIFGGGPSEDTREIGREASSNAARGYGINLRALDAGSTLVLINGRRLAGGGAEGIFTDVSSLLLTAVERIDIIPETSSTQYGADAVGGTVNFVMRDHFDGRQTTGHFGATTRNDLTESYASQLFGATTDSGRGLLALDFYTRGNLPASRRTQMTSDLRAFGGTNFNQPYANPGTVITSGTTWAVPKGQDGTHLDPATLVPGTRNSSDKFAGTDALPAQQRWGLFGTWKNELTDSVSVFAGALFSHRAVRSAGAPAYGAVPIPVTNAYYVNPGFGPLFMGYSFGEELGPIISDGLVTTNNVAAGLEWDASPGWHVVGTASYASEALEVAFLNSLDRTALQIALADPDPATSLNLFGDGNHTNPATIERLRTTSTLVSRSFLKSLNVTASGALLSLHDGVVQGMGGVDYREQALSSASHSTPFVRLSSLGSARAVTAWFGQVRGPLWGRHKGVAGLEKLELTLGVRQEHYSDFGRVTTPRYALDWSPWRGVTLHASRAHSFRAPTLLDKNESSNATAFTFLPDDAAPFGRTAALIWYGKNANLRHERARSWTAGFDLQPARLGDWSFAATYFDIYFTDRLSIPSLSADVLTNPIYADLVVRAPSKAQIAEVCSRSPLSGFTGSCELAPADALVDLRVRNDASVRTRGIDLIGKYVRDTDVGTLSLGVNGTYILDFSEVKSRGLPMVDRVSTQNYPIDLRLRGSVGWRLGPFDVTTSVNFANHYRDTASVPRRHVRSMTTLDVNVAYTFGASNDAWALSGLGETRVALGATNLFDQDPPFLNNGMGVGYDEENADIIGRFIGITVTQNW